VQGRPQRQRRECHAKNLYVLIRRAVFVGKSTKPQHVNTLIDLMSKKFDMVTCASFSWDCVFEASYWYCRHGNPKLAIDLDNWHATSRKNEFLKLHASMPSVYFTLNARSRSSSICRIGGADRIDR
jgi:hypothetical protein